MAAYCDDDDVPFVVDKQKPSRLSVDKVVLVCEKLVKIIYGASNGILLLPIMVKVFLLIHRELVCWWVLSRPLS